MAIEARELQQRERFDDSKDGEILIPDGVIVLTVGTDTQDDRIELEVVGWGEDEQSWSICYEIIHGNPGQPYLWEQIDKFLQSTWRNAAGQTFSLPIAGLDTGGHYTQDVYAFCGPRMGVRRGVLPVKGASKRDAPVWQPPARPKKGERDRIKPYMIGVHACKDVIYNRLQIQEPGPGYMHFPVHYPPKYFEGLTAEKIFTNFSKGFPVREYRKIRNYNEPLDCRVYAYAMLKVLNPDWSALKKRLEAKSGEDGAKSPGIPAKPAKVRRKRKGYVNSW